MATEQITVRLSDQDPIEAEIIKILRSTIGGRKSHWVREMLVCGYQTWSGGGSFKPVARYTRVPTPVTASEAAVSEAISTTKAPESMNTTLNTSEAAKGSEITPTEIRQEEQSAITPPTAPVATVETAESIVKPAVKDGAQALRSLTAY